MMYDIKLLDPYNEPDSVLEEHALQILKRQYELGQNLHGHPLFMAMVNFPDNATIAAAEETVLKNLVKTYECYESIIRSFSWKRCRMNTWRGDYLVVKGKKSFHVDCQSAYTHEVGDGDNTPKKLRNKLRVIYRDAMKLEIAKRQGVHTILVDENSLNGINHRIAKMRVD